MKEKQKKNRKKSQKEINRDHIHKGISLLSKNLLFYFYNAYHLILTDEKRLGKKVYANVSSNGEILINTDLCLSPENWAYIIAHNALHLAFGHFDEEKHPRTAVKFQPLLWNMACDLYIHQFLLDIKIGKPLKANILPLSEKLPCSEVEIYEKLLEEGISHEKNDFGTGNTGGLDMIGLSHPLRYNKEKGEENKFVRDFSRALISSVTAVIQDSEEFSVVGEDRSSCPEASWFINHYPLLGGLAAHFKIIKDFKFCHQNEIQIAAVDAQKGEIYLNPAQALSQEQWKFVLAHEYLHAGLMHHERCCGRDSYLWNVACDFVINGWLVELKVGSMPSDALYDPLLKNLSAESIYDQIMQNIKKYEKLSTFRGYCKGDVIRRKSGKNTDGVRLDDFCISALQQGLDYHIDYHRGLLPAGLIEEIRALSMPVIPWDVELARWFECYFTPLEKHRSYARPSRRQGSTPDIPRPAYYQPDLLTDSRTFGVVIDTSGSMTNQMLAKALGSIASYSEAHEVPFARVMFCDAHSYDAGYLSPVDIAGRVQVKGRGGTVLQPGIDALEAAEDFPKDAPILIITDGECEERLTIKRKHAFLLPFGKRLPFHTKSEVFYFK